MERSDFSHIIEQQIRWGDMDALGHVNNIMFFRFFESGRIAYIDSLSPDGGLNANTVLADIRCSFLRQLHYPGSVAVGTRVARIGNRSLTLCCALFSGEQDEAAATGRAVLVWYDFAAGRSRPVPDELRAAILAREIIVPETAAKTAPGSAA